MAILDVGTETEWIAACQWQRQCSDQCPRKMLLPLLTEPLMSPLEVEKNSTDCTTLCFQSFAVLGVNGDCAGSNWCSMQVAGHMKSHTKHLPCDQGTWVEPSRRLPSFRNRHDGSSLAGISGAASVRFMKSLTALCRKWRPADRRHDRPWKPYWSTFSPPTHGWGVQSGVPRRSTVVTQSAKLSRSVPTDDGVCAAAWVTRVRRCCYS